jgi:hypothetical protein
MLLSPQWWYWLSGMEVRICVVEMVSWGVENLWTLMLEVCALL